MLPITEEIYFVDLLDSPFLPTRGLLSRNNALNRLSKGAGLPLYCVVGGRGFEIGGKEGEPQMAVTFSGRSVFGSPS